MTIAFNLEVEDLLAFYKHFYKTNKALRRGRKIVQYGFPALFMVMALVFGHPYRGFGLFLLIYLAAVSVWWIIFMPRLQAKKYVKALRKSLNKPTNLIYQGPRTMAFDEEGVKVETALASDQIKWQAFVRWVEVPGYIFLYIAENAAHVIPLGQLAPGKVDELKAMFSTPRTQMQPLQKTEK